MRLKLSFVFFCGLLDIAGLLKGNGPSGAVTVTLYSYELKHRREALLIDPNQFCVRLLNVDIVLLVLLGISSENAVREDADSHVERFVKVDVGFAKPARLRSRV